MVSLGTAGWEPREEEEEVPVEDPQEAQKFSLFLTESRESLSPKAHKTHLLLKI